MNLTGRLDFIPLSSPAGHEASQIIVSELRDRERKRERERDCCNYLRDLTPNCMQSVCDRAAHLELIVLIGAVSSDGRDGRVVCVWLWNEQVGCAVRMLPNFESLIRPGTPQTLNFCAWPMESRMLFKIPNDHQPTSLKTGFAVMRCGALSRMTTIAENGTKIYTSCISGK